MSVAPLFAAPPVASERTPARTAVRNVALPAPRGDAVRRSVVIPVFNGAQTVAAVVDGLFALPTTIDEVVLVNDGSRDDSERVCRALAARYPGRVTFVQLDGNYGEHAAVTAGFRQVRGAYTAVIDDDGQHPPEAVARLFAAAERDAADVVFARFPVRRHPWHRRWLSRLFNFAACCTLGKPRGLYLSSFKVVQRSIARQIADYDGACPYVDGVVLRAMRRPAQVDVVHCARQAGRSGYTLARLVRLAWLAVRGWSTPAFRLAAAALVVAVVLPSLSLLGVAAGYELSWPRFVLLGGGCGAAMLWCADRAAAAHAAGRPFQIQYVLREAARHA